LDVHSPVVRSFWWAHLGWILCRKYDVADVRFVKDWLHYPELRWLDRHFLVPPTTLAIGVALVGWLMERFAPAVRTSPLQLLLYGFVLSTVVAYHCTFAVNSVAHRFGRRRFETDDDSRNNWLVALFTLGEGWHNNHHDYPAAERHGLFWWEVDVTHYALAFLAWSGIVWNVRTRPAHIYATEGPRVQSAVSPEAPPGTVGREPEHAGGRDGRVTRVM